MVSFISDYRAEYGVESICANLPIAQSTFYEHKAREDDPDRLPNRAKRDLELSVDIQRVQINIPELNRFNLYRNTRHKRLVAKLLITARPGWQQAVCIGARVFAGCFHGLAAVAPAVCDGDGTRGQ